MAFDKLTVLHVNYNFNCLAQVNVCLDLAEAMKALDRKKCKKKQRHKNGSPQFKIPVHLQLEIIFHNEKRDQTGPSRGDHF